MQQTHSPLSVAVSTVVFVVLVLLVVLVLVVIVLLVALVVVVVVTMSDKATGVYIRNFSSLDPVTTRSRKKIPYHG